MVKAYKTFKQKMEDHKKLMEKVNLSLSEEDFLSLRKEFISFFCKEYKLFNELQFENFSQETIDYILNTENCENIVKTFKGCIGFGNWLYSEESASTNSYKSIEDKRRELLVNVVHDIEEMKHYKHDWYSPRCENYAIYYKEIKQTA